MFEKKKRRITSDNLFSNPSSSHQGNITQEKHVAPDGTIWLSLENNQNIPGRRASHNILKEQSGPTAYAKRCVLENSFANAWRLFIDEKIMEYIRKCTIYEAHRQLQRKIWTLSLDELEAFISILYVKT